MRRCQALSHSAAFERFTTGAFASNFARRVEGNVRTLRMSDELAKSPLGNALQPAMSQIRNNDQVGARRHTIALVPAGSAQYEPRTCRNTPLSVIDRRKSVTASPGEMCQSKALAPSNEKMPRRFMQLAHAKE